MIRQARIALVGTQAKYTPTKVDAVRDVIALAAGGARTCVLERGGTVRCWGDGVAMPTAVVGLEQPVAIALGSRHACALDRLGVVSCWGAGDAGQLGCGGRCPADATARRVTW
jgi:alpha-tubulin suppressor-like RCC1 family protein